MWLTFHLLCPSGYFLSLFPVGGNRTTAVDLISPVFLPSLTCQVINESKRHGGEKVHDQHLMSLTLTLWQITLHYYIKAAHGDLQVLVQTRPPGQSTVLWKHFTQTQTWQQTDLQILNNHTFQVWNYFKYTYLNLCSLWYHLGWTDQSEVVLVDCPPLACLRVFR